MLHELETKIIDSYLNKELTNIERDRALWLAKVLIRLDYQSYTTFDAIYKGIINTLEDYKTVGSLDGVSNEYNEKLIEKKLKEQIRYARLRNEMRDIKWREYK